VSRAVTGEPTGTAEQGLQMCWPGLLGNVRVSQCGECKKKKPSVGNFKDSGIS
jgi:hypothetical protein